VTGTQTTSDTAMLTALLGDARGFDTTIDPRDEMLQFATGADGASRAHFDYFRLGHELTRSVEQLVDWAFPGERDTISILEFACGYGRNLRHLVTRFPRANITVSDIDADAVAFLVERFGVTGKLSEAEPANIAWPERYDLIIVPSLFSHLPHATFGPWLTTLSGLLTERGVLAFSVHDESLMPAIDMAAGIHFTPFSEADGRLDGEEYGTTVVTEGYVAMQVAASTGRSDYGRVRRGFWDHQDLYLVAGPAQKSPAAFVPEPPITGHVDDVVRQQGGLRVTGWTHALQPGLTLRARMDDTPLLEVDTFTSRPDVAMVRGATFENSGFDLEIPLPAGADGRLLVIEATAGDQTACFYALPIERFGRAADARAAAPGAPAVSFARRVARSLRRRLRALANR
jgi:SAM-dependent methyltransferase